MRKSVEEIRLAIDNLTANGCQQPNCPCHYSVTGAIDALRWVLGLPADERLALFAKLAQS